VGKKLAFGRGEKGNRNLEIIKGIPINPIFGDLGGIIREKLY
jgi:hypothetical protein